MFWQSTHRVFFKALCVITLIGFSPSAVAAWHYMPLIQATSVAQTDDEEQLAEARKNYGVNGKTAARTSKPNATPTHTVERLSADAMQSKRSRATQPERVQVAAGPMLPGAEELIAATTAALATPPAVVALAQNASTAVIPPEQQTRLDQARAYKDAGDLTSAVVEFIDILDDYSRQPVIHDTRLELQNIFKDITEGRVPHAQLGAMIEAAPTTNAEFAALKSPEARYVMLDFFEWSAGMTEAAEGRAAAATDYRKLMDNARVAVDADRSHVLNTAILQKYLIAAESVGYDALMEAAAYLESIALGGEKSFAAFAAYCELANYRNGIWNDVHRVRKYSRRVIDQSNANYYESMLADETVYDWARAQAELQLATAYFRIGRLDRAKHIVERMQETYQSTGELGAYADWILLKSDLIGYAKDPIKQIEKTQAFLSKHPDSGHIPYCRLEFARIYELAGDVPGAIQLYEQVIFNHPQHWAAQTATRSIDFLTEHQLVSLEVANYNDEGFDTDFNLAQKCGPIALQRMLAKLGVDSTVEELESLAKTNDIGTSMQGLIEAAKAKGVGLQGVAATHAKELPTPFIPFVSDSHFVLVTKVDEDGVTLQDAMKPEQVLTHGAFAGMWNGEAIVVSDRLDSKLAELGIDAMREHVGGNILHWPIDYDGYHDPGGTCTKDCGCGHDNNGTAGGNSGSGSSNASLTKLPGNPGSPIFSTGLWQDGVHAQIHTGRSALWLVETDIAVPTIGGVSLSFQRTYYNEHGKHDADTIGSNPWETNIGEGWRHDWNIVFELDDVDNSGGDPDIFYCKAPDDEHYPDEQEGEHDPPNYPNEYSKRCVTVYEDDGETIHYEWCTPPGPKTANSEYDGNDLSLLYPDGREVETGALSGTNIAKMTKITTPAGGEFTLSYDASGDAGKLTKISPPSGDPRYLQLSYSGNLITKVELKKTATPSHTVLQTVEYFYDANDELTKVEDDAGNTVLYEYGSDAGVTGSRYIKKITDKRGKITNLTWTYGQNGSGADEAYLIEVDLPNGLTAVYDRNLTTDVCTVTLEDSMSTVLRKRIHTPPTDWNVGTQYLDYYLDTTNYERYSYSWHVNGMMTELQGPGSKVLETYAYDSDDRMTTAKYGANGTITYAYDTNEFVPTKITGLDSLDTDITYNAPTRPSEIKHPRWDSGVDGWRYFYNASGQVTKATNPIDEDVTYTYDSMGNLSTVTVDPTGLGLVTDYDYDDYGNATQVTDPRGKIWKYFYDGSGCGCGGGGGNITKTTDPNNNDTLYYYDANQNVTKVTDAELRDTLYYYDDMNRLTKVEPVITGTNPTMTMEYNLIGEMTKVTDFEGNDTTYEYDHMGRVTKVKDDAADVVVEYAYDSLGRLTSVKDGKAQETLYYYDDDMLLTKVVDDEGKTLRYYYDSSERMTKVGAGSTGTVDPTVYAYSSTTGLMTKVDYYYDTTSFDTADYAYDGLARVDELDDWIADDVGNVALKYYYDAAGRLTKQRDYDNSNLTYAYDDNGNVTSMTDYHSNTTTYAYDNASQLTSMTAPGSKTWSFAYNDIGQITSQTAPNDMVTTWDYDERNRLDLIQHLTQASGGTVVDEFDYELNDAGNITKITEVDDSYWTYAYDVRDRLTTASLKNSSGNVSADWSYTYDDADNMLTKVAPFMDDFNDGNYTGWTAAAGTWSASSYYLEDTGAGTNPLLWKNDFTDDDHEMRFRIQRTNSSAYTMVYVRYTDSSNWIKVEFSGTNSGLREKVSGSASYLDTNTAGAMTEDVWYNVRVVADGDNVKVWIAEDGEMPELIFDETVATANESSSKVGFTNTTGSTVEYDDVWLIGASVDNTYTMTYNTANELTSMTQPNGAGTMSYSYDDWGRQTKKNVSTTFTADYAFRYGGLLEDVDTDFPGESDVTYLYNSEQKRVKRTEGANVEQYRWDGWNIINTENGSGTLQRTYTHSPNKIIGTALAHVDGATPSTGDYEYYVQDQIGTTRAMYDQNDVALARNVHSPYGVPFANTGDLDTPLAFSGKPYDSAIEQSYFPYRQLESMQARWTMRDPVGIMDGPNLYGYVGMNPIDSIDPLGLSMLYDFERWLAGLPWAGFFTTPQGGATIAAGGATLGIIGNEITKIPKAATGVKNIGTIIKVGGSLTGLGGLVLTCITGFNMANDYIQKMRDNSRTLNGNAGDSQNAPEDCSCENA